MIPLIATLLTGQEPHPGICRPSDVRSHADSLSENGHWIHHPRSGDDGAPVSRRNHCRSPAGGSQHEAVLLPSSRRRRSSAPGCAPPRRCRQSCWSSCFQRLQTLAPYFWILATSVVVIVALTVGFEKKMLFVLFAIAASAPVIIGPIGSTLLLAMGRRERLISAVVIFVVETIIGVGLGAAVIGLTHLADAFMPQPYQPPDMRMMYLLVILVPLNQLSKLALARKRPLINLLMVLAGFPLVLYYVFSLRMPAPGHVIGVAIALISHSLLWGVMAYEFLCRDLGVYWSEKRRF